jgi:3-keto-5-aminohexanoate cleavage enzyme
VKPLPRLMVAPNGARKTQKDHPTLPMTLDETIQTAIECQKAGADGLHLHQRGPSGAHILDADLYLQAIAALKAVVPDMAIQITTEAVGVYTPEEQRKIAETVQPDHVSISLAEMLSVGERDKASTFYQNCAERGTAVQHILYGPDDLEVFQSMLDQGELVASDLQLLFVLGRYNLDQQSSPSHLDLFTDWLDTINFPADWAVCAFGHGETDCLKAAIEAGGKARVGFENSFFNSDGSLAKNNAERVQEISRIM